MAFAVKSFSIRQRLPYEVYQPINTGGGTIFVEDVSGSGLFYPTFVDQSGNLSVFKINSSYLPFVYKNNSIGIGTEPDYTIYSLDVSGSAFFSDTIRPTTITDKFGNIGPAGRVLSSTGDGLEWILDTSAAAAISVSEMPDASSGSYFYPIFTDESGNFVDLFINSTIKPYIYRNRRLGIGVDPLYSLDVCGNVGIRNDLDLSGGIYAQGTKGLYNQVLTTDGTDVFWKNMNDLSGGNVDISDISASNNTYYLTFVDSSGETEQMYINGTLAPLIYKNQSIGIGKEPVYNLDVSGNIGLNNDFDISGGIYAQGTKGISGEVLVTNGNNVYWSNLSDLSAGKVDISDIDASDSNTYYLTFTNISGEVDRLYINSTNTLSYKNQRLGIRTNTPEAYLDVSGFTILRTEKVRIGVDAGLNNQSDNTIAIGNNAGKNGQEVLAIAIGSNAGSNTQGVQSIAIGFNAGSNSQGIASIAIGQDAGSDNQKQNALAIGFNAGRNFQERNSIAIGNQAGYDTQYQGSIAIGCNAGFFESGTNAISIGSECGYSRQATGSIAIGYRAAYDSSNGTSFGINQNSIAIGNFAGHLNQNSNSIAIGLGAGNTGQQEGNIAIGLRSGCNNAGFYGVSIGGFAGNINSGDYSVAIGFNSGRQDSSDNTISIGYEAGYSNCGQNSIAIGFRAGESNHKQDSIAIGTRAGQFTQQTNAVAIGYEAGKYIQGSNSIALGMFAGFSSQQGDAVAIGTLAGRTNQNSKSIAIGCNAGSSNQGGLEGDSGSIAIGTSAGASNQGGNNGCAIAIGNSAGFTNQGFSSIAIGCNAGQYYQKNYAVAIGSRAGFTNQGSYSIAIGYNAGLSNQYQNTIVLNATNTGVGGLETDVSNSLYIAPIRGLVSQPYVLGYDISSKEVTYFDKPNGSDISDISAAGLYYLTFVDGSGNDKDLFINSTNTLVYKDKQIGLGTNDPQNDVDISGSVSIRRNLNVGNTSGVNTSVIYDADSYANLVTYSSSPVVYDYYFTSYPDLSNTCIEFTFPSWTTDNVILLLDINIAGKSASTSLGGAIVCGKIYAMNTSGGDQIDNFTQVGLTQNNCSISLSSPSSYTLKIVINPTNSIEILTGSIKLYNATQSINNIQQISVFLE